MINFLGLLIIIGGFFIPYITVEKLPSIFFFWAGFLLFLWPNKYFLKLSAWLKWARIGVLLNVAGLLLLFFFSSLLVNTALSSSYLADTLLKIAGWIFTPVSGMFDLFFPVNQVKMPDGSIQFEISLLRGILTSFFNVVVYSGFGIVIGKLYSERKHVLEDLGSLNNQGHIPNKK